MRTLLRSFGRQYSYTRDNVRLVDIGHSVSAVQIVPIGGRKSKSMISWRNDTHSHANTDTNTLVNTDTQSRTTHKKTHIFVRFVRVPLWTCVCVLLCIQIRRQVDDWRGGRNGKKTWSDFFAVCSFVVMYLYACIFSSPVLAVSTVWPPAHGHKIFHIRCLLLAWP